MAQFRAFFVFVIAFSISGSLSHAVELKADPKKVPQELQNVGVKEHLGETIDLNLELIDSSDQKKHQLKEYFKNGKPVLLNLVYYECPMLCTMVLNGVTTGLKGLDWVIGQQFNVLTVSINPKEEPGIAEEKRAAYIREYLSKVKSPAIQNSTEDQIGRGWHFFTSDEKTIQTLANQLGFEFEYDQIQKEYAHPAVTYILTPEGMISRNLYGISYSPRDLRFALLEASKGKVGNVIDRLLMFCYRYEPGSRGYALQAVRVMQLAALATIAILAGYLSVFWIRQSRKKALEERKDILS